MATVPLLWPQTASPIRSELPGTHVMSTSKIYLGIVRGKFIFDGAKSIDDMVDSLVEEINNLRKMKTAGIRLKEEVDQDHANLITDDPEVAREFGFKAE